jgi:hypothetical protein
MTDRQLYATYIELGFADQIMIASELDIILDSDFYLSNTQKVQSYYRRARDQKLLREMKKLVYRAKEEP